jgi:hypothetical protein
LVNADLEIADNTVATVSQDYKDNAAILTTYVDGARILHNDISDAPYDGVAVGWGWGYNDAGGNPNYDENQKGYLHNTRYTTPTTLRNTLVEGNRIHGVKTWYMDGGAIYNLSANPGAVIRENHIFDIGGRIGDLSGRGLQALPGQRQRRRHPGQVAEHQHRRQDVPARRSRPTTWRPATGTARRAPAAAGWPRSATSPRTTSWSRPATGRPRPES